MDFDSASVHVDPRTLHLSPSALRATVTEGSAGYQDSAEYVQLCTALTKQGEFLGTQSQSLQRIQEKVDGLIQVLQTGGFLKPAFQSAPVTPAEPVPPTPPEASGTVTRIATPERYDGSPDQCQDFLMQCELVSECSPHMYQTDAAKTAFVLSLLTGPARAWATAGWRTRPRTTYDIFREKFEAVFDHPHAGRVMISCVSPREVEAWLSTLLSSDPSRPRVAGTPLPSSPASSKG
uniref:DUF4939 domain-containing protein n=1 Tax=Scleropages formosus TaxID=113540 RepID=A0A8C9WSK9_SCLFO